MPKSLLSVLLVFYCLKVYSQDVVSFEITDEWLASIEKIAPEKTTIPTTEIKKILVFSKATGYDHWTIPHNAEMLKILAKKTKAFEIHIRYDIANFEKKNLENFDAVILNNSNPAGPERNLFTQLLRQNTSFTEEEVIENAKVYEQNLMNYVFEGGGLMILHGAITMQNNSVEFSRMTGGSFDYHPKQQEVHVKEVDKKHPLVKAFNGKGLTHFDEPYFFKNAYAAYNFRPLLYMEVDKLEGLRDKVNEKIVYLSWIKRHGEGRVFYSSPSHNAQSFERPELLQFFLDGMQYVVGDLHCDDTPIEKK